VNISTAAQSIAVCLLKLHIFLLDLSKTEGYRKSGFAVPFFVSKRMEEDNYLKLFKTKKNEKPTALVFVDFEYMQISFKKRYGIQPPILDWYKSLCAEYDVRELYVFADFSNEAMKRNLPILRQITDNIIETQNTASRHKKDFTDFQICHRNSLASLIFPFQHINLLTCSLLNITYMPIISS
jgi:hypothetical protein